MSHNQSRAERSDSTQYRKTGGSGTSNQQRNFPAGASTKGGGGASFAPSNSGGRNSFKKYNNSNGQGGKTWERSNNFAFESAVHDVQNYPHPHQPSQRVTDVPVTSATNNIKQTIAPQNISGVIPSGPTSNVPIVDPTSNVTAVNSEPGVPTAPAKGDASKSFPLQFGSIIPGSMNGVQVPARTSSAPPNLDEQKKDQVRRESLRAPPSIPIPSIPKHHVQKKDGQNNSGESQAFPKSKREPQNTALPPPMTQSQNPTSHHIPNMAMQLPYHQPQIPLQFGGPNPQIPSQAMSATSLPLPMQMQMLGNPQMQQPMFISGLQPHPMQSQGIVHHQGHNFNFSSPMSHQLPSQMGNTGINLGAPPQFPQPQAGKYGTGSRKIVKITHPDTNEEVMLDTSSGPRSHPIAPPPSQAITSYPPNHQMSFYPSAYNASPLYFPGPGSVSLNNNQAPPSQPLRISKQVTVKQPVGPSHVEKDPLPAKISTSVGKSECKDPARLHDKGSVRPPKEVETSLPLSSLPQTKHDLETSVGCAGIARKEEVVSDAVKDKPNELGNIGQQDQVCRLSVPTEAEAVKTKSTLSVTGSIPESAKESLSTTVETSSDASNSAEEKTNDISVPEIVSQSSKSVKHSLETSLNSLSLESPEITAKNVESSNQKRIDEVTGKSLAGDAILLSAQDDKTDMKSDEVNKESSPVLVSSHHEGSLKPENEDDADDNSEVTVPPTLSFNDKVSTDVNAAKVAVPKGKKKKNLFRKAEAAGTSSDLYNAYKGPEEKKEPANSAEGISIKLSSAEVSHKNDSANEKPAPSKTEPDDWEDAAENSPQLPSSKNDNQGNDRDVSGLSTKKYSRDFLLKFIDQCTDLPEEFEITPDIDALMGVGNILRESSPSPVRNIDRPGSRSDRRSSGLGDEDKWNKFPGPLVQGRGDSSVDAGYAGNNIVGFRSGQGGNYGVPRNLRTQAPVHHPGGILAAHVHQFLGPQPPQQRNNSDSDRWQRGTGFGKGGLMPSPQTVIHRAERKYEVGKVTDEEQAKQRQLKGILNKLTPQNFEKLFQQVKEVNIDNVVTLSGVIAQIFDKALTEPTFCEMYADFCFHLAAELPELSVENEKITFKRLLLNKCQEEFERGEREEEEANKAEEEGESKQTAEEREENRLRVRRRMLGNIRLIGELYKKRMLTERIMHGCINKLLGQYQNPDEENIEALCKLMSTIGVMIDHPKAKDHMDVYFDIMTQLSNNMRLSSRVRFMLKDSIDLRRNKWQQRRKVEGPKKIEDVHRDAAQERHAQSSRVARIPNMGGSSTRRGPPMEFAPRGAPSLISSPGPQVGGGGFRGGPHQVRGYGLFSQDTRTEERHSFENRILPQRSLGDDNITLGPQGGLVKGMGGFRGQQSSFSAASGHLAEGDGRRLGPAVNGLNSVTPERVGGYGRKEDLMPRYAPNNRVVAPSNYDAQERSVSFGNREQINMDQGFDTSLPTSQGGPPSSVLVSSDKMLDEDLLREKSITTIVEFYSARDENEVVLCMKEFNSPSYCPSMISNWIVDSFERKDIEREVLAKLLINLSKAQNTIISEDQLIKGFESVLSLLEDAKNDAPRAAEFLGHTFARVVLDDIISLSEIGRLIYEGGEVKGRLVEEGLAAEVLGSTLDKIKSEKGDSVLNEIRSSSNLQLEKFRPPGSKTSLKLDKFM